MYVISASVLFYCSLCILLFSVMFCKDSLRISLSAIGTALCCTDSLSVLRKVMHAESEIVQVHMQFESCMLSVH